MLHIFATEIKINQACINFHHDYMLRAIRSLNTFISITIVGIAMYILGAPFAPDVLYAFNQTTQTSIINSQKISSISVATPTSVLGESVEDSKSLENELDLYGGSFGTLQIGSIGVDGIIHEGDKSALDKGIWRRPNTSTPDKGGNTVIVAHRFLYTSGSNTFYHLDKVQLGEVIQLQWKGKLYSYKVFEISEVLPQEVYIENNTLEPIITLYTCTPLFTADKRLVVKARMI